MSALDVALIYTPWITFRKCTKDHVRRVHPNIKYSSSWLTGTHETFGYHFNDILIRDNMKLFKKMQNFHKYPTVAEFNEIINYDCELYDDKEVQNPVDDLYIELELEDKDAKVKRIMDAKKQLFEMKKTTSTTSKTSNFCKPEILVWAYAAIKQFPWLLDLCEKPLYIDRASKFMDGTYFKISSVVAMGPIVQTLEKSSEDNTTEVDYIKYFPDDDSDYIKYKKKIVVTKIVQTTEEAEWSWCVATIVLTEFSIMQYFASGNDLYLTNLRKLVGADKTLKLRINNKYYTTVNPIIDIVEDAIKHQT